VKPLTPNTKQKPYPKGYDSILSHIKKCKYFCLHSRLILCNLGITRRENKLVH